MPYEAGDIIIVKRMMFKESGLYDSHEAGRPALIIHTVGEVLYYLPMSSSVGSHSNSAQYYCFDRRAGLSGGFNKSIINCKSIYKSGNVEQPILGKLPINYLGKVLENLVNYQEHVAKDEFYDEISEDLKNRIKRCEVEYDETNYRNHRTKG